MAEPESFRRKVWLLIIDKVIIGAAIGFVLLVFYLWSEGRREKAEERRYQQRLAIERAALAGQLLPSIVDTYLKVDARANLLSVLTEADALRPGAVARLGQILIGAGVSKAAFVQAIRRAMLLDAEPFLKEVKPLVRNWRHYRTNYRNCADRNWGDSRPFASDLVKTRFSHWKSTFETYLEPGTSSVRNQLNSEKFLGEHLYVLANLLSPDSSRKARNFSKSEILAIKLVGHLTQITFEPKDLSGT